MNKKAQPANQIFTYIIAVVVIGVIFLFGYQAVSAFRTRGDQINIINFQKELETAIKSTSNDFGTIKTMNFGLSNDYSEVCFVANNGFDLSLINEIEFEDYPVILDSIKPFPTKNIFLIKNDEKVAEKFMIGNISLENNKVFECFDVKKSVLRIKLEGKGDCVAISQ